METVDKKSDREEKSMDKRPVYYTAENMKAVEEYVERKFSRGKGMICHEITSEYIHSDVMLNEQPEGELAMVTVGMGAREMDSPLLGYERAELVMWGSQKMASLLAGSSNYELMIACGQLVSISKFPFRHDTWLGTGHTINANSDFEKLFGYQYFLLLENDHLDLDGHERIIIYNLVPIYEDEREWLVDHSTSEGLMRFIEAYLEYFGEDDDIMQIDVPREHIIPNEEDL